MFDVRLDGLLKKAAADDLALLNDDVLGLGILDVFQRLLPHQQLTRLHEDLRALQGEVMGRVEVAQQGLVVRELLIEEPQRAQEGGAQELALAVDARVEQTLRVQLELDPAAAIGDDLGAVEGLVGGDGEEYARAAVQLGHDHALGAIDDEGAPIGHGRDIAEVDFGFLALFVLAIALIVLVELVEPYADLQGRGHGGTALDAFLHAHLGVQAHGLVAHIADGRFVLVALAALGAIHREILGVIRHDVVAAVLAGRAQMRQAFVLAALAGPVAHGVVDELDLEGRIAAIHTLAVVHGEHGVEHGPETAGLPLGVEQVHLEEFVVTPLLDINQIGDGHQRADLRKLDTLTVDVLLDAHA